MAGEKRNEESEKKREWNDGDATLHSMSASRILPLDHAKWLMGSDVSTN